MIDKVAEHFANGELFISHLLNFKSTKAIVLFHGFPAYTCKNEDLAQNLFESVQANVLLMHYRGLGNSKGVFSFAAAMDDSRELLKYLIENGITDIALCGHSFGGALALILWQAMPEISKLILLNPIVGPMDKSSIREVGKFFMEKEKAKGNVYSEDLFLSDAQLFNELLIRAIENLPNKPLTNLNSLIVQGTEDEVIDQKNLEIYIKSLSGDPNVIKLQDDHWFSNRQPLFQVIQKSLRSKGG